MEQLLILLICILIYEIYIFKIYRSASLLLYWGMIDTFFVPVIYYSFLNETSYGCFGDQSYYCYMVIGIIMLSSLIIVTVFLNRIYDIKIKEITNFSIKGIEKLISISVIAFTIIELSIYGGKLPLIQLIQGTYLGIRPDTSGVIPHYFVLQTCMLLIIPMILLYYNEMYQWGKWIKNFSMIVIFFLLIAGGNQGWAIYFVIFIWVYELKLKLSPKVFYLVGACLLYYFYIKGIQYNEVDNLISLFGSPARRFFLTQPAMFINRISMMDEGYVFSATYIDEAVYQYVYREVGGSAPTFYMGDFIVLFDYVMGGLLSIVSLPILLFISAQIDLETLGNRFLYKKWAMYSILLMLLFSSFTFSFLYRSIAVLIMLFAIDIDSAGKKWRNRLLKNDRGVSNDI